MAATRLIAMHQNKGMTAKKCLDARFNYIENKDKTEDGTLISSYACDKETAAEEFILAKQEYYRLTGRKQKGDILAYQIRQSFKPGEIAAEEANRVGYETAMRFTKGKHAFIVATHTDRAHIHNHIIFNSTNLECNRKFRDAWFIALVLQKVSDAICLEHGLSVIKPRRPSERDNQNPHRRQSFRKILKEKIDEILADDPKSFEEFLKRLQEAGYEIKNGKHIAVRGEGQKRFIRFDSIGEGYSEKDIRKRIAGEIETDQEEPKRKYRKKSEFKKSDYKKWDKADNELDLLIDINKKMQEGKGKGYERWAKIYNIKQISKALLYLQDHGIRDYSVLEQLTKEATGKFHQISDSIKEKEDRLAEIAELKKHMINYMKTNDIYAAYRKSGYSKKFLEAHRKEILLHKAAKEAFDKLHVNKLPRIKDLSEEYGQIIAEKKKLYEEYRTAKKEMMNYQIAKQDIDQFLRIDAAQHEKEQEQQNIR